MGKLYVPQEDAIIRQHYGKLSSRVIAQMVGHSQGSVCYRAKILGVNNRGWHNQKTPEFLHHVLTVVAGADSIDHAAQILGAKRCTLASWIRKAKARL